MIRSDAVLLPEDAAWFEATAGRRSVTPGLNPDCV